MADTEIKKIEVVVSQQGAEKTGKGLDDLTKSFQDLMDKARKANPSLIAVENRLKLLKNAMIFSADATVELRKEMTNEIKVLPILGKEYKDLAKARFEAGIGMAKTEKELDESGRIYMETLRKTYTSIEAVNEQLKLLTIRQAEARKSTGDSDLQYSKRVALWAQEKHQLNIVRQELVANEKAQKELAKAAEVAAKAQQKAADEAAAAQEKQSKSLGSLIKKGVLWFAGTASMYYLWRKLRTEILNSIKEVYESSESYAALTKEINNTKSAMVLALTDYSDTVEAMGEVAKFLQHVQMRLGHISSAVRGFSDAFDAAADRMGVFETTLRNTVGVLKPVAGLILVAAEMAGLLGDENNLLAIATATAQAELQEYNDALASANSETDKYSSQISSLVSRMRDFNDAAAAQVIALREIKKARNDSIALAIGGYQAARLQIDIDLQKDITAINKKALESRAKAYEDYQDKLNNLQRDGNKARQNDAERHALEMEFAQRRHNLSLLQNERMYQYSRGLLVAEGDVLAIEDLDARYALEKQAAEENFALQMQQAEAMFRLQAKIQADAMRDQVAALQLGLRDQLAEIEEGRREEIAEAEAAAKEKEAQAADEQATALAAAIDAYNEELKAQEEGQAEREKALADFFVDMAMEMGIGYEDALGIAKRYFDVGGSFDSLMKTEWERQATYIAIFTEAINTAINSLTVLGNKARSIGGRGGRIPSLPDYVTGSQTPRLYAHGTDTIVSSPTNIGVGERGPERVIVQPLSPIGVGGNVSMSWRGGPIPIHGTGGMSGIDEGAMGNAIAQGIVDQMALAFSSIRGSRGN